MKERIVIMDKDDSDVYGLLTVKCKCVTKVWDSFSRTKERLGDNWTIEDLINGLTEEEFEYSWSPSITYLKI